jgi:hypothetical protein
LERRDRRNKADRKTFNMTANVKFQGICRNSFYMHFDWCSGKWKWCIAGAMIQSDGNVEEEMVERQLPGVRK